MVPARPCGASPRLFPGPVQSATLLRLSLPAPASRADRFVSAAGPVRPAGACRTWPTSAKAFVDRRAFRRQTARPGWYAPGESLTSGLARARPFEWVRSASALHVWGGGGGGVGGVCDRLTANGGLAPAGCKRVPRFQFAPPQSGVNKSYVISAVAPLAPDLTACSCCRSDAPSHNTAGVPRPRWRGLLPRRCPSHPRPHSPGGAARWWLLGDCRGRSFSYTFFLQDRSPPLHLAVPVLLRLTFVLWRGWAPATLNLIGRGPAWNRGPAPRI